MTCKTLGLLFNTFPTDKMYPVLNRDTNPDAIVSEKKTFYQFFAAFLTSRLNLNISKNKMTPIDFVFSKLQTPKT